MTGVLLLGIALFVLALSLRSLQMGVSALPAYVSPAGAGAAYVLAAVLLAGFRLQALVVFALMCAGHVSYAFVMGSAFVVLVNAGPASPLDVLVEGLSAYPPATLLQVAFVLPAVSVLAWPWLPGRAAAGTPAFPAVEDARCCRELAQGILSVQAVEGATAEAALACIARRAQALLADEPPAAENLPPTSASEHASGPAADDVSAGAQTACCAQDASDADRRGSEEGVDGQDS